MGVNKVDLSSGEVWIDLTKDSVTPDKLASGVTAHDKSGALITGTMQGVNCKIYRVNIPTALAAQFVTLVTGDADVAAHYADDTAMVTVRKMTNNNTVGTAIICHTNHAFPKSYGFYMNGTGSANHCAVIDANLSNNHAGVPFVRCTSAGEIKVQAQRTNNNFGGADYIVTFSW